VRAHRQSALRAAAASVLPHGLEARTVLLDAAVGRRRGGRGVEGSMSDDDGQRFHRDIGKPRWSLVPVRALRSVLAVMEFGAAKYGARTYLTVPDAIPRYAESLFRHVEAVKEAMQEHGAAGVMALDDESGLPHLAHA